MAPAPFMYAPSRPCSFTSLFYICSAREDNKQESRWSYYASYIMRKVLVCNHGHNIPLCLKMTIPLLIYPLIRGLCKEISLLIKCIKDASRVLPEREVLVGILATPLRSVDAREQTHTSCHCARTEDRTRQGARQGGEEKN